MNRHNSFMIGLLLLFIGIQLRMVDSYVLNEKTSKFLHERLRPVATDNSFMASAGPAPRRTIQPPPWLGFAFISAGSVVILHSLAMKKPGG